MTTYNLRALLPLLLLMSCAHVRPGPNIIPKPVKITEIIDGGKFVGGEIVAKLFAYPDRDAELGDEGYQLDISDKQVTITANTNAGIFYGQQTIKQGLMHGGVPAGVIRDYPRFVWRGAMLDIARHFFAVSDILRYIDLLAFYKINRLHLHLADDQGWRIEIKSWPNLTTIGGRTQIGGGIGGFLTQEDYAYIVSYAQKKFITIVPEIEMPGHVTAALVSYPELGCDEIAPEIATVGGVLKNSLCIKKEITYKFIDDVVKELASITPGPFIHIGGDESAGTQEADYEGFIPRVEAIVKKYGKTMIGWEEILSTPLSSSIAQLWRPQDKRDAKVRAALNANKESKLIVSTASKAYLDMKYNARTQLGLGWAGFLDSKMVYEWNPLADLNDLNQTMVLGVEAPLWSETVETISDIEYMTFPRMMSIAEIGWTRQEKRDWKEFRQRAATHGPMLKKMGVDFYKEPGISWE